MTYKSIVANLVEREARQALEKVLGNNGGFDFGTVEMQSKDGEYQNFAVDFKEFGRPWTYRVIGFICNSGFVSPTHYRLGNSAQYYDIQNGKEVR